MQLSFSGVVLASLHSIAQKSVAATDSLTTSSVTTSWGVERWLNRFTLDLSLIHSCQYGASLNDVCPDYSAYYETVRVSFMAQTALLHSHASLKVHAIGLRSVLGKTSNIFVLFITMSQQTGENITKATILTTCDWVTNAQSLVTIESIYWKRIYT